MRTLSLFATPLLALFLFGCLDKEPDGQEDRQSAESALSESTAATSAALTMDGVVEVTTAFTIGQGVEEAAAEMAAFVESQIPCTTVTRTGATVVIDFGGLDDLCLYKGRTYAGTVSVMVAAAEGTLKVTHAYDGLNSNGLGITGTSEVTWSANPGSRRVVHDFTWTYQDVARTGTGDRTWTLVNPGEGIAGGLQVDGTRSWTGPAGQWTLDIEAVQMRMTDPVPYSGAYVTTTPKGKTVSMSFAQQDEDTIRVTFTIGERSHSVDVTRAAPPEA